MLPLFMLLRLQALCTGLLKSLPRLSNREQLLWMPTASLRHERLRLSDRGAGAFGRLVLSAATPVPLVLQDVSVRTKCLPLRSATLWLRPLCDGDRILAAG